MIDISRSARPHRLAQRIEAGRRWRAATAALAMMGSGLAACTAPSSSAPAVSPATSVSPPGPDQPVRKKLIEIGWDTPGAAYVRDHVGELEALPFDGIALTPRHGHTPVMFEDRAWTADDVQLDVLSSIQWKRFTDNYLSVRGQSPTGAGWFDDARWDRITGNTRRLSAAVAAARARGIFFDPEFYYEDEIADSAWRYNSTQYPGRDFATVEAQVRRRGAQFMKALQSQKPDVTVVFMFSLGMVYAQAAEQDGERASVQYALIPAFVNGMLDAAGPAVRIIDGNEGGYYYRTPEQDFANGADWMRNKGAMLVDPKHRARYRRDAVGVAVAPDCVFGLWTGTEFFEACSPGKMSPADLRKLLEQNIYHALRSADEVVWLYNESFDLIGPNLTGHLQEKLKAGLDRQAVLDAIVAARERANRQAP